MKVYLLQSIYNGTTLGVFATELAAVRYGDELCHEYGGDFDEHYEVFEAEVQS